MPKRGLPERVQMRHDAHYVETLAASAAARRSGAWCRSSSRSQPRSAAPGDGRSVRADCLGRARRASSSRWSSGSAATRYQIIAGERRYHAAVPGRADRSPGGRPRRRRHRDARARAGREHPAQGPDAVRRSRSAARAWRSAAATPTKTSPSGWGSRAARSPNRCPAHTMPAGGPQGVPPRRHRQQVDPAADCPPGRSAEDAGAGREDRQPRRRHPRAGPQGNTEAQSRPAQGLHLQLQAARTRRSTCV